MSARLEMFRCLPLSAQLTRSACGARHARAVLEVKKRSPKGTMHLVGNGHCAECPIGAAHRRGEEPETWPEGRRLTLSYASPPPSLGVPEVVLREEEEGEVGKRKSPRIAAEKVCVVCRQTYQPTGNRQLRCANCAASNRMSGSLALAQEAVGGTVSKATDAPKRIDVFGATATATPSLTDRDVKPDNRATAALDLIRDELARLEERAAELRHAANVLAQIQGITPPYPIEGRR